jgi:hypothetical protein
VLVPAFLGLAVWLLALDRLRKERDPAGCGLLVMESRKRSTVWVLGHIGERKVRIEYLQSERDNDTSTDYATWTRLEV